MGTPHRHAHRIFLVRHGETVDNVAGLLAGSRDSALTNHGVIQGKRLAEFLKKEGVVFTHIFSSPLARARKTADYICEEQRSLVQEPLSVTVHDELRERDFGSLEGVFWKSTVQDLGGIAQASRSNHLHGPESKESLRQRSLSFLDQHLLPALDGISNSASACGTIAIVSHGLLLAALWQVIISRLSLRMTPLDPSPQSKSRFSLGTVPNWSNTGYLEFTCTREAREVGAKLLPISTSSSRVIQEASLAHGLDEAQAQARSRTDQQQPLPARTFFDLKIEALNSTRHLQGLKRSRGGIGSSAFDERQTLIGSFFETKRIKKS